MLGFITTDVIECDDNTCDQNKTCKEKLNGGTACICQDKTSCPSCVHNHSGNDGKCKTIDTAVGILCLCLSGWEGDTCSQGNDDPDVKSYETTELKT